MDCLNQLDEEHRAVLVFFTMEDLSVQQIAQIANIPEGTVKSRLHYAREKMQQLLASKGVVYDRK